MDLHLEDILSRPIITKNTQFKGILRFNKFTVISILFMKYVGKNLEF